VLYYRDPADHNYRSEHPGLNPETGNDLEPVYDEPGPGHIAISSEKQQWIGVRSGVVERMAVRDSLRVPGRVAVDETRITRVTSRTAGWIDRVHADFTGRLVKQGEPLVSLYSPELTASQQEYLLARKARATLSQSTVAAVRAANESMVDAARERLRHHWGLDEAALQQLEESGEVQRSVTLYAPATAFITARSAYAGARVTPETELYTLADLSRVWIIADVFEADAARIRLGQHAAVEPAYAPGRRFSARVTYIFPRVDPQSRTLPVRLEAENRDYSFETRSVPQRRFPVLLRRATRGPGRSRARRRNHADRLRRSRRRHLRTAPRANGRALRGPCRNPERPQGRRAHRRLRRIPAR
jgi:membrane fusion protein, copper/silver efflux system